MVKEALSPGVLPLLPFELIETETYRLTNDRALSWSITLDGTRLSLGTAEEGSDSIVVFKVDSYNLDSFGLVDRYLTRLRSPERNPWRVQFFRRNPADVCESLYRNNLPSILFGHTGCEESREPCG